LAGRGSNAKYCGSVPLEVRDYFHHELDRSAEKKRARQHQSLLGEEVATEGNVVYGIDTENDEELQGAIHISREEEQYVRQVREQGGRYEHGGGSSQQHTSGGFLDNLKRTIFKKEKSEPVQTRIDTGPWIAKSKQAKSTIGKAWAKFFQTEAISDAKANNPYFIVACKETQIWGKLVSHLIY
jgi:hypothetical protein